MLRLKEYNLPIAGNNTRTSRWSVTAAKCAFFLAGFAIAAWAPLVPFIKNALKLSHLQLSGIILLMSAGSLLGMILVGLMMRHCSSKTFLSVSGALLIVSALLMCTLPSLGFLAVLVLCFGLSLGALEVGSNIYGSHLEKKYDLILLPTLHGCYSAGEIASLAAIAALLSSELPILLAIGAPLLILGVITLSGLLTAQSSKMEGADQPLFVLPRGKIIVLAAAASLVYMAEGGMLDWSALYLMEKTSINIDLAGTGYIMVVSAMALGRFMGAFLIRMCGVYYLLSGSVLISSLALALLSITSNLAVMYVLFFVLGFAMANVMPVAISLAGAQTRMPPVAAIASISSLGYTALLLGPALIGFVSEHADLSTAFRILSVLIVLMCLPLYRSFGRKQS